MASRLYAAKAVLFKLALSLYSTDAPRGGSRTAREALREIVRLELKKVERRLKDKEIALQADDRVLDLLAREGYDPVFGARPLRRLIHVTADGDEEGKLRFERLAGAFSA